MIDNEDVPELVPARMLNEFCYCPRLFHIEWVQRLFADNEFTVDGRWVHRVVDEGGGRAPSPDGDELRVAKSLQLSSERLGLVGKVDLLEADATDDTSRSVVPVEYKRGSAPDLPEGAFEPERVQLCALGLLLRDAGYRCTHGQFYFAESRKRVRIDFDSALVARTMELLGELREVAACPAPPPPLEDSPKCDGCSLVGICLPDETNLLARRTAQPPRRLLPNDPSSQPLYVTEPGSYVGKQGGRVRVSRNHETLASVRMLDVSQLCVFGNVSVSSPLVRELLNQGASLAWFSSGGWYLGHAHGMPAGNVDLRRRQFSIAESDPLPIARRMIEGKIRNSRTLVRRNSRDQSTSHLDSLARLAGSAVTASSIPTLLGIEGTAARIYFAQFPHMLKPREDLPGGAFTFEGRRRRPPPDPVNCLLSYAYSLLNKDCAATLHTVGFDPMLGFLHRPRFGRPALALDLAEEFRPLISESIVLTLLNNGEVKPADFVVRAAGVALTQQGRRVVLKAYERRLSTEVRHPTFGYRISYRRALEVQARLLAAVLMGEFAEYHAFTTR